MSREIQSRRGPGQPDRRSGDVVLVVTDADAAPLLPDEPFVKAGLRIERAQGFGEAMAKCSALRPPLIFLPLSVAGARSTELLKTCLDWHPKPVLVVIATHEEINAAAEAMRLGAFDCLFRPFSPGRLAKTIAAALDAAPKETPERHASGPGRSGLLPPARPGAATSLPNVLAASEELRGWVARAATLATSDAPVVITGEVGTGKSLFAEGIHAISHHRHKPLVRLDSPTVASQRVDEARAGLDTAGTLLVEEICDLAVDVQAELLAQIDRWSGTGTGPRIIATTHQDPKRAIREGRLRAELFYRLDVGSITLPPLRGRADDIALIARTRLTDYVRTEGRGITGFTDAALAVLAGYDWPGNVRELLNLLWMLALTQDGPLITPATLPQELTDAPGPGLLSEAGPRFDGAELVGLPLAEIERLVIEATIRAEGGSVPRAARVLDVSPSTIYRKRDTWEKDDKR